jgi:hypothetical protein
VKRHRARNWILGIVGGIVILFIGVAIGSAGGKTTGAAAGPQPTVTVTATATARAPNVTTTPAEAAAASPGTTMSSDGVYVVGTDIKHGTYHTTGAVGGSGGDCYYALLSSTNTSDIIDNNNVTGPATITVGPGVKAVDVSGCNTWTRIGS